MEGFCGLNLTGLACWIGDDESTQIHELCLAVQGCSAPIWRPEGSGAEAARGASLLRSARIRQREPKSGVFGAAIPLLWLWRLRPVVHWPPLHRIGSRCIGSGSNFKQAAGGLESWSSESPEYSKTLSRAESRAQLARSICSLRIRFWRPIRSGPALWQHAALQRPRRQRRCCTLRAMARSIICRQFVSCLHTCRSHCKEEARSPAE